MNKALSFSNRFGGFKSVVGSIHQYLLISNIHKYLFLIALMVSFIGQSQTLDKYLQESIENNPSLQSSFTIYKAYLEKVNQVSLESPQLNIGVFTRPMELLMGSQRAEASVMQMFPWFGMLRTQKDEATLMAEAKYEEFRQERNMVLFRVKEAYFQLQQIQNTINITQSNLEILTSLEELAIIRYQGGNTSQAASTVSNAVRRSSSSEEGNAADGMGMGGGTTSPSGGSASSGSSSSMSSMGSGGGGSGKLTDVLRLRVQIKALESNLDQLEVDKGPLLARFNQLLGRDSREPVNFDEIIETEKELEASMLENILETNPMLQMLDREGLAYQKQGEMAKLEGKPMFGLGLNFMVFSSRSESGMVGGMNGMDYMPAGMGGNMVMPMATVTLPIYRKKYKSMEAESKLWWEANERQKEDLQRNLVTEFETILASIKNAERKINLLKEQIELTEQTMELSITSYATEGSSFEEILNIQRELLEFKLDYLNLKIERELAFAKLETLIGI